MIEIKVPTVGESISEVSLAKWLKKDGQWVERDEVLAEIESEKATFEINAEQAGLLKIIANEGDTLTIGATVCKIEGGAAESEKPKAESVLTIDKNESTPAPSSAKADTKEIKVPAVGESITEVTLTKWLKQNGDAVAMDEVIAELESDKATFELPAESAGILNTVAQEGDTSCKSAGGDWCKTNGKSSWRSINHSYSITHSGLQTVRRISGKSIVVQQQVLVA